MLETTLSTAFVPGVNVKGDVAGANWMFLRPRVHADHVVCLGVPAPATLATLARFSGAVSIIAECSSDVGDAEPAAPPPTNVHRLRAGMAALPLGSGTADLVVVADGSSRRRFVRDERVRDEAVRLLKCDGVVYIEYHGARDPFRGWPPLEQDSTQLTSQQFRLTPLTGEVQTAAPEHDRTTIEFLRRQATGVSLGDTIVQGVRRFGLAAAVRRNRLNAPEGRPAAPARPAASPRRSIVRTIAARVVTCAGEYAPTLTIVGRVAARHGAFIGTAAARLGGPPRYLCTLAAESAIDITSFRWGLLARSEYSSRKLLFFLYDPADTGGNERPRYIAKMVRASSLNPRLENESKALRSLRRNNVAPPDTVPEVAFFGYHAGLAVVGETIVQGVPFRERTRRSADCPLLSAAVDWLTDFGTATAAANVAMSSQVGATLGLLLNRFQDLYHVSTEEERFLCDQVSALAGAQTVLPATFQHGDPGLWNMLATPQGGVALLDWEAAEPCGMPLWDLFYFLRSYIVDAARARGVRHALDGVRQQLFVDTPLARTVQAATRQYCARVGVPPAFVEPLFHTCWMHRALKEATRLPVDRLQSGHYVNLLRLCVAERNAPAMRELFHPCGSGR